MNKGVSYSKKYLMPDVKCIDFTSEGILCSSPVNPGYGGNEDMEEGDDL